MYKKRDARAKLNLLLFKAAARFPNMWLRKTEYSQALDTSYTSQPVMSFWWKFESVLSIFSSILSYRFQTKLSLEAALQYDFL